MIIITSGSFMVNLKINTLNFNLYMNLLYLPKQTSFFRSKQKFILIHFVYDL
jgi:hypothetical protein